MISHSNEQGKLRGETWHTHLFVHEFYARMQNTGEFSGKLFELYQFEKKKQNVMPFSVEN